jgi:hypothetical protein
MLHASGRTIGVFISGQPRASLANSLGNLEYSANRSDESRFGTKSATSRIQHVGEPNEHLRVQATSTKGIREMSLTIESNTDFCPLTMTEIRMRVANIKSRWSDEDREERAELGRRRRRSLGSILGSESRDLLQTALFAAIDHDDEGV